MLAELIKAFKTCRRLKDTPIDVHFDGTQYHYCPNLDKGAVEYGKARAVIRRNRFVEWLVGRWC